MITIHKYMLPPGLRHEVTMPEDAEMYGTSPEPADLFLGAWVVASTVFFLWRLFKSERRV